MPVQSAALAVNLLLLLPGICASFHPLTPPRECAVLGATRALCTLLCGWVIILGLELRARGLWVGQRNARRAPH